MGLKEKFYETSFYLKYIQVKSKDGYNRADEIAKTVFEVSKKLEEAGVFFAFVLPPNAKKIANLSDFEKYRIENWTFDFNHIREEDAKIIQKLYENETIEHIVDMYDGAKVIERRGHKTLADFSNDCVHIVNGKRVTPGQPSDYHNSIHIYGACTVRGTGVEDENTISGYLQRLVNADMPQAYRCVNDGVGCGSSIFDDVFNIQNTVFRKGDIVLICNLFPFLTDKLMKKYGVRVWDVSHEFDRPHSYGEWFTDEPEHTNKVGNSVIAQFLFKKMKESGWIQKENADNELIGCIEPEKIGDDSWIKPEEFQEYVEYLRTGSVGGEINGGIVMNCNPFTLGHRYLIETALKQVDNLYIFVVEEDKSFFPFEDRLELVKKGVADLKNVHVLKSGKFILSAITFPGYFYKENNNDAVVDTSMDIDLFARYIAPELNIKKRFAGEEPLDLVTKQYNETMAEILPRYGIEFVEIKRKADDVNVVSASRVRAALKEENWDMIRTLVPITTYEYLEKRFRQ